MHRVTRIAFGAFVVPCLFASMLSAQNADVRWTRRLKFSASDKREVIALAKLIGVADPVSVDANLRDDCCRIVFVTGRVVENGAERRWTEALMIRGSWREYANTPPPADRLRVGSWIADGPPQVTAEWRVRDGAWFVDLGRGTERPSVPYRDAELIVLALHRGTIVNKIEGHPPLPTLKGGMRYMLIDEPFRTGPPGSEYEIWFSTGSNGGTTLRMRIVGDTVEAVSLGGFVI